MTESQPSVYFYGGSYYEVFADPPVFPPQMNSDSATDDTASTHVDSMHQDSMQQDSMHQDSMHHQDSLHQDSMHQDSMQRESMHQDSMQRESMQRESMQRDSLQRDSLQRDSLQRDSVLERMHSDSSSQLPERQMDGVSMTLGEELSSSVSTDTGFCSVPPLPSDASELCDLQDPQEDPNPDPPPPPAIETPPGSLYEEDPPIEDVTLALKELDDRCEEEGGDFSDMSRLFGPTGLYRKTFVPTNSTSPPPSPFLSAILAAFQPVAYESEEEAWRCHVNQMLSDTDGSSAVLFQNMQKKFSSITHSSVRFLGENLQRMGNQFLSSLEVMTSRSQCPTVLLDAETLALCAGVTGTLDTYNAKREAAEQWLENCRKTFGDKESNRRADTHTQVGAG
ncbi:hypothetical protein KUCAC02_034847, partial [Chaenocephalus aceratus]